MNRLGRWIGYLTITFLSLTSLLAQTPDASKLEARNTFNNGVSAFRASHPREAVDLFTRAMQLDPDLKVAELYLASAYASMFKPGDASTENQEFGKKATDLYERIVQREPSNAEALSGLASMYSNANNFQKAREVYLRLTKLATQDPKPFYAAAATNWLLVRNKTSPPSQSEAAALIAEGLTNVDIALALNPQYMDAMTYKNLLLREQAAITSDPAKRASLIQEADSWFAKALDERKQQQVQREARAGVLGGVAGGVTGGVFEGVVGAPPPPPPPPGHLPPPGVQRVGAQVAQANLINSVNTVYPPLARAARVQGVVMLQAVIDKQGTISDLAVISGHELLIEAAIDAVRQWRYRPVLLNGQPVDVVTTITVNFVLQ